ncbi:SDR family NAD(P)-dependent oxidoreductase [Herbiconiux sp. YIM B11900]|uniref:SDR family NAD(P)-dependent oxidoreductase n=1 Tax=Herbiconiux sp. YIM B11900 TaxID=3404131 RepID=UPI003F87EBBD
MDLGITGRTALVTGGDSGIGWRTARLLLAEGVTVVTSDIDEDELDEAAAELDAPEDRLHAFAAGILVQPYDDELPYRAAEAGILALAKGLSRSYALEGLRVNAVSPAVIQTPMTDATMHKRGEELGVPTEEAIESFFDEERPHMELKRRGEPDEGANVVLFLCSEAASFVNGSNYRVDSGSVATI